ncbi:MAG: response regulator [Proteobacteria bacterium]|nr:response regulator [Pseudomonadota bacterium]
MSLLNMSGLSKKMALAFYFPTEMVLVDDNPLLLRQLKARLGEDAAFKFFDNPLKASEFFLKEYQHKPTSSRCFNHQPGLNPNDHLVQMNVNSIFKEIYNPERFNQIAILIVDYAMPRMNGLQLAEEVLNKFHHMKIIMLTGEADTDIALSAFTDGKIHGFYRKDDPDLANKLKKAIKDLLKAYFYEESYAVVKVIIEASITKTHPFTDPVFVDFIEKMIKENNIEEWYLAELQGSYCMIDNAGKVSLFIVRTKHEMEVIADYAERSGVSKDTLKALQDKTKLAYFLIEKGVNQKFDWERSIHPAYILHGDKDIYYYAWVKDISPYNIHPEKILTYKKYLSSYK